LDALEIEGDVFDPNVNGDETQKRANIAITWSCLNILTNSICVDRSNVTIDMTQFTGTTVSIPAGSLTPYNGYYFKMNASKDDEGTLLETQFQIIIIASEYNVPVLGVSIPGNMVSRRINLDEQIIVTLDYSETRADDLSYRLTFIYQEVEVATLTRAFTTFRFRFQDVFTDFI
jgi:hypothetical protein